VLAHQSKEEEAVNGSDTRVRYRRYKKYQKPLIVFLHEVVDSGNLGAMVRSAVFLGASAVAVTAGGSATLSPVAAKAAAGAAEEIPIFIVENDMDFVTASKKAGWRFYAAAPPGPSKDTRRTTAAKVETQNPLAKTPCVLVLGSEGKGLPKNLRRAADYEISIPGAPKTTVDSLNVSVAGGILCNSFLNPSVTPRAAQETEEPEEEEEDDEEGEEVEETDEVEEEEEQEQPSDGEAEKKPADGEERLF
ncbi:hypothetical protein IMZ48_19585, partial [Candidatus Bathyarchaeota archaeon]|nr:hypothetical protein [Candidatus Bathyarchaeota archaeon]